MMTALTFRGRITRGGGVMLVALSMGLGAFLGLAQPVWAQTSLPASRPATRPSEANSLAELRKDFQTKLTQRTQGGDPVAKPPANLFRLATYDAKVGKLPAYVTPDPRDGRKHPAIVWITGGDCNSIGDVWSDSPEENDQTAAAYRKAGIIMMFPSLRGGNRNPGQKEGFYGEVDDVLAAAKFLAAQPYVDPSRIYLGGHSTGGTLALLVAECSETFRAVFSFGPVDNVTSYGSSRQIALPFDRRNKIEVQLRAPELWLQGIKTPTFVFEGEEAPGNSEALKEMVLYKPKNVQFFLAKGQDHFSILAPANRAIAAKIVKDGKAAASFSLSAEDLPGLERVKSDTDGELGAGAKPELLGTVEGNPGSFSFQRSPMKGIRYDLTQGDAIPVLRTVSGFADTPDRVRGTEKLVQARDGYIVYGLVVDADRYVNAIRVVFVKVQGDKLVTNDTYMSDWLGTPRNDEPTTLGCDGRRITKLIFHGYDRLNAIGLNLEEK